VFAREERYGAHNYHPLPVALNRAEGTFKTRAFLSLIVSAPVSLPYVHTRAVRLVNYAKDEGYRIV